MRERQHGSASRQAYRVSHRTVAKLLVIVLFVGPLTLSPLRAWAEFHGNPYSHVFHAESCKYFDCKACTVPFATAKDAIAAGYHPCKICKPSDARTGQAKESVYIGNSKSHVFHRATCRYAHCKTCGKRFAAREEAIRAGHRPCKVCRP